MALLHMWDKVRGSLPGNVEILRQAGVTVMSHVAKSSSFGRHNIVTNDPKLWPTAHENVIGRPRKPAERTQLSMEPTAKPPDLADHENCTNEPNVPGTGRPNSGDGRLRKLDERTQRPDSRPTGRGRSPTAKTRGKTQLSMEPPPKLPDITAHENLTNEPNFRWSRRRNRRTSPPTKT